MLRCHHHGARLRRDRRDGERSAAKHRSETSPSAGRTITTHGCLATRGPRPGRHRPAECRTAGGCQEHPATSSRLSVRRVVIGSLSIKWPSIAAAIPATASATSVPAGRRGDHLSRPAAGHLSQKSAETDVSGGAAITPFSLGVDFQAPILPLAPKFVVQSGAALSDHQQLHQAAKSNTLILSLPAVHHSARASEC